MGQGPSTDARLREIVKKLSKLEIKDIEAVFLELSTKTNEGQYVIQQPSWLNRDKFAEVFGLNDLLVEQLFQVFDKDQNGIIDMQEFVTGMAVCLHGGIKEKCQLLFKIFNLDGDEGISRDELSTILASCLTSANVLLESVMKTEGLTGFESQLADQTGNAMAVNIVVNKIVKDAFETCDVSNTGKLEIDEFANWVHKNPKLVDDIFVMQCPKPSNSKSESLSSEFSVLATPDAEIDNEGVFTDASETISKSSTEMPLSQQQQHQPTSQQQTLLKMSQNQQESKPIAPTIDSLFNSSTTNEPNFFDSFGSSIPHQGIQQRQNEQDNTLPRPASDLCLSAHKEDNPIQSSLSHYDLNTLQPPLQLKQNLLIGTQSMQSITLSQDSIYEDNSNTNNMTDENITQSLPSVSVNNQLTINSQVGINNVTEDNTTQTLLSESDNNPSNINSEFSINNQQPADTNTTSESNNWHPLQSEESHLINTIEENRILNQTDVKMADHPNSFVNTALHDGGPIDIGVDAMFSNKSEEINEPNIVQLDPLQEKRRGYSFWQPSDKIQSLLNHLKNGGSIEPAFLTTPSVLVEGIMGDPVREMVKKYLGDQEASKRPVLSVNHIQMNEEGLQTLLAAGSWRTAVDFTTKYLTTHGQGLVNLGSASRSRLSPGLLQIWFVRIALLVKLRMVSSAEAELNAFHDFEAPDLYYEYYPDLYPGKRGSIVPFSLRLIHAEIPQHNGRPNVALDRLYSLLRKVELVLHYLEAGLTEDGYEKTGREEEDDSNLKEVWRSRKIRLHYAIGNCFLSMKEYSLAVHLFEECIKLEPDRKVYIRSGIGRIYLQLGDLKSAQKYFKLVEEDETMKQEGRDPKLSNVATMNSGYMKLAISSYAEANQCFQAVISADPDHLAAYNNAAVCLLFLGKVKEASNILETMVWRSPERSLHEDILFNVSTVYELETSRAIQKKYKLLDLVCQHRGDGFAVQCLKLT